MVEMGAGEMAQQVKGLAAKAHVLRLIPRTYMVEGENLIPASCPLPSILQLWHSPLPHKVNKNIDLMYSIVRGK